MKNLLTIILVIFLMGCEELERPNADQFVLEGFITADFPINDIKVKETIGLDDTLVDIPISDADVRIIANDEVIPLDYNSLAFKYADQSGASIQVGATYEIEIEYQGTVATASTIVPEKPIDLNLSRTELVIPTLTLSFALRQQIADLFENEVSTFTWDGVPGRSYFVVIETQEEELDPIIPEGVPEESKNLLSSFRFISAPSEETSFNIIGIALETYGRHVAKVYSVNEEYVELFNSATQDSRDLNEPPSNINNGLGIFTAFAVDSLEFTVVRE